jgi:hypothetical protein
MNQGTNDTGSSSEPGTPRSRATDGRAGSCSRWWIEWQWTDWTWWPEYFEGKHLPALSRLSSYKPHFWARWLGWTLYCTAQDGREWTKQPIHLTGPLGVLRGLLRWRRQR